MCEATKSCCGSNLTNPNTGKSYSKDDIDLEKQKAEARKQAQQAREWHNFKSLEEFRTSCVIASGNMLTQKN